jgi:CheY-like chemotaxis protein
MACDVKTILLVEDDCDIREMLVQALASEGYSTLEAANGQEALDILERQDVHPCLVLLDLMMPVLNGWGFLKALKKENADILASLPVYIVSAAGENEGEAERQASGFMKKPVDLDQLFKIVESYCSIQKKSAA